MSSETRRLAGRYVLEAPIGRGGMGEVWRGTDTVLGREVAVKTIDLRRLPDESGAARFEREARVTAGLNHAGIVTVHDHGVEGDTAYLVMELLPGPSLADRIADGPVPVDEVVEVGQQVAAALDAAHARGLVHRDIKPANIAYAGDGRVRVLDFGITQLGRPPGRRPSPRRTRSWGQPSTSRRSRRWVGGSTVEPTSMRSGACSTPCSPGGRPSVGRRPWRR